MSTTYTVKQVADILGYSTNSIYTFLKEKRLQGVRVGKGRFRIPQSELDRLLGSQPQLAPITIQPPVSYQAPQVPYHFQPIMQAPRVEVPSLFDWFAGIASIILGLAMFLFSRANEEFAMSQYASLMPILRVSFITGGFGILFTDVIGKRRNLWHVIFHAVLVASYAIYSLMLLQYTVLDGVALFGSMTLLLVMYTLFHLDGVAGFIYYIGLVLCSLVVVTILAPQQSGLVQLVHTIPWLRPYVNIFWIGFTIVVALLLWIGHRTKRHAFHLGTLGISTIMAALSVYFAQNLMWGRSLYVLVISLLSFFIPVWQNLSFAHKRDRMFVFGAFGSILSLFVISVGAVRIMQTNIISYAGHELNNKVMFGKFLLESTFSQAISSLSAAAANPILIDGLDKGDTEVLLSFLKNFFESNQTMSKIVILSSERQRIVEYPYELSDKDSYVHSDYIVRALSTKKLVLSDAFEPVNSTIKRKIVTITVPVLNAKNEVAGLIVGSLSVDVVGNKLQQIVSSALGESVIVIDRNNKIAIHPDLSRIGTETDNTSAVSLVRSKNQQVLQEDVFTSVRAISVYATANGTNGWVVGVLAPIRSILQVTPTATITIFSLITLSMLIVVVFFLSHRVRYPLQSEGYSNGLPELPNPKSNTSFPGRLKKIESKKDQKRRDTS